MNYFHTKTINLNLLISSGVGVGVRQIDEGVPSSNHLSVGTHHMHKVWLSFCGKNLSKRGRRKKYIGNVRYHRKNPVEVMYL